MENNATLPRIPAEKAAEICRHYQIKSELGPLLADGPGPLGFLDRLLFRERYVTEAVEFLAFALPKREAVWWGCLCLQSTWNVASLMTEHRQALRAAARWTLDPTEENRRAAEGPAQQVGVGMPSGCLALATFESGGSINPPDQTVVPPHPLATAQGVRNAINLLAAKLPADQIKPAFRRFVALGIGLARSQGSQSS